MLGECSIDVLYNVYNVDQLSISLLIFLLYVLFKFKYRSVQQLVLNGLISPINAVIYCFLYLGALFLGTYIL